jgi:hypothetical protein
MNSSLLSYGFAGMSLADFSGERPGSPSFCRARPSCGPLPAQIPPSRHPPAPSHFFSKRPGGDFPPPRPISPPAGTFPINQARILSPVGLIARQILSGSVQWRCIRNGSEDVQAVFPRFSGPNHCGYTAKHYAELGIMVFTPQAF